MARLSLAAMIIAALLIARSAEADTIDLDYVAPAGCPTEDAFRREVDARTVASAGADMRVFRVRVEATRPGFAARLEIEGDVREARAPTCAAAIKSIAVFIALARAPLTRVRRQLGGLEGDRHVRTTSSPRHARQERRPRRRLRRQGLQERPPFPARPSTGTGGAERPRVRCRWP